MKKLTTIFLLAFTVNSYAQFTSDVHRKYIYSIDNQLDNINGLNFGLMRMSLLQNNRLRSSSSENTFFSNSSLEQNTTTTFIQNHLRKNAAGVGFDNWGGYTLQGNYSGNKGFNISASANAIERQQKLEGTDIQNNSAGFLVNGGYHLSKNKLFLNSKVEIGKDQRNYDVLNRPNRLHLDNNYGLWSNKLLYKLNPNASFDARANLSGYQGSVESDSFVYEGTQSLLTAGIGWKQTMKHLTMRNDVVFQTLRDNNWYSRKQNRWEYSNVITPRMETIGVTLRLKNGVIYTDSMGLMYTPSLAATLNYGNNNNVQLLASRFLRTQANSLERWPYYSYSDDGIQNITIDQIQGYNTILYEDFKFVQMLRYQQFSNFSIADNGLESMARASVGMERNNSYYKKWNYSGIYHYRFAGKGELAQLAPIHSVVAQVGRKGTSAAILNKVLGTSLIWDAGISTGYRSRAATLTNCTITDEQMQNLFFTDVSYTLSNRRNYSRYRYYGYDNKGVWQFTIEIQNIFNAQTLTANQRETKALLLTEGIRTARQIKLGVSYKFR